MTIQHADHSLTVPGYESAGVIHHDDIEYSVFAFRSLTYPETHIEFYAYRIRATDITETSHDCVRHYDRGYDARDDNGPAVRMVYDAANAEVFLRGSVKWDGCSNWEFTPFATVSAHFCDKEEAMNIGVLFQRIYEQAKGLGMDRL